MYMENTKVKPHQVRERLSRDVHAILSVCIQHFDDDRQSSQETCFDVDAVIEGRGTLLESSYKRRVQPAAYARPTENSARPEVLSVPGKGYFIPQQYAAHLQFA